MKDGDNIVWYDNQPYHIGKIDKYDGFLSLLKDWAYNRITHIHTLNHDMLLNPLIGLIIFQEIFVMVLKNLVQTIMGN